MSCEAGPKKLGLALLSSQNAEYVYGQAQGCVRLVLRCELCSEGVGATLCESATLSLAIV